MAAKHDMDEDDDWRGEAVPYGSEWVVRGFIGKEGQRFSTLRPVVFRDTGLGDLQGEPDGLDPVEQKYSNATDEVHLYGHLTRVKLMMAMNQMPRETTEGWRAQDMGAWTIDDFDYWSYAYLHEAGIVDDEYLAKRNMFSPDDEAGFPVVPDVIWSLPPDS